jgi:hypothetical protein
MKAWKNAGYKMQGYGFVRCNIGDMEQTKWCQVKGKVGKMACRRNKCNRSGVYEIAVAEMVHG